MRKAAKLLTAAMLALLACAAPAGCGENPQLSVEGPAWSFTLAQREADGSVAACSADRQDAYGSAPVADLFCEAKGGVLALGNRGSGEQWKFCYRVDARSAESVMYELSGDNRSGRATVSVTEYHGGGREHTLIVTVAGYALYFAAPAEVDA